MGKIDDVIKEILNYYNNYLFESKKEEIKFLEEAIKKEEEFNYKKYLENLNYIKKKNDEFPIIDFIFNTNKENNNNNKKIEEEIKNISEKFEQLEKSIKGRNAEEIFNYLEENNQYILFDYFKDLNNREILLKIFNQDDIEFFLDNEIINEENLDKLREIKKYYENYLSKEKTEEINILNNIIQSRKGKYQEFLNDLNKAKNMNLRFHLINCFLEDKNNFEEAKQHWEVIEQMIKEKKSLNKMKNRKIIINKLKDDEIKKILYQIIEKEPLDIFFKTIKEFEEKAERNKKNKEIKKRVQIFLKLYKENYAEIKKEEITLLENGSIPELENFLNTHENDYDEAKKMMKENTIGEFLDKTGEIINDKKGFLRDHVKLINEGKNKKMKKHYKNAILKYIEKEEKEAIADQYFTQEQREKLKKNF